MALSADRKTTYRDGIEIDIPVYRSVKIYAGSLVCVGGSHGYAIPAADASGNIFMGVAMEQADNSSGNDGDISVRVRRKGVYEFAASSIAVTMVGDLMYVVDDQTFDETSPGNSVVAGILVKYVSATKGWIDIEAGARVGATIAATAISVADSANYFEAGATTAEAVLAEIGAELAIYNKGICTPLWMALEDGTALTKHSGAPVPGFSQLSNKEMVLMWATHATPGEICVGFLLPDDVDDTAAVEVHILGAVSGATDTPLFTTEVYIGAGDTNCGGDSTELTGGLGVVTEEMVSVAHGDVPAGPAPVTVVCNPKDGQLGNDSFYLYAIWLEYTKKKA